MAITENKNVDNLNGVGLGIIGIVALPAASPQTFVDVGYLKAVEIDYTRELKEFESAGILIKRLAFRDRLSLKADFAEVSITNLAKVAQGTTVGNSHRFGGDRTITRYAVRHEFIRDDGLTITTDLYRTVSSGKADLKFQEENFITYPQEFIAEVDTTKPSGQRYGKFAIA